MRRTMHSGELVVVALMSSVLWGCGGADSGETEAPAGQGESERAAIAEASRPDYVPKVEEAYQDRIDEAWRSAVAGENPSATCAAVKGRAVASASSSAEKALAACNVEIPARYFLTFVDRVEAGEKTCNDLMMEVMTKLPAMTMSMEGFRDLAEGDANTSDTAAVAAGAAVLAGAAAGGGATAPREAVKERLRDRVTEVCPQEAGIVLR